MKKRLCMLLMSVCIFAMGMTPVSAAQAPAPLPDEQGQIVYYEVDGQVILDETGANARAAGLRYKYFDTLTACLTTKGSLATCTGTALVDTEYTFKMTCTLQRSKDGKSWSTAKTWSTTESGVYTIDMENQYYMTSGYRYRLNVVLVAYQNGIAVEQATCRSSTESY